MCCSSSGSSGSSALIVGVVLGVLFFCFSYTESTIISIISCIQRS